MLPILYRRVPTLRFILDFSIDRFLVPTKRARRLPVARLFPRYFLSSVLRVSAFATQLADASLAIFPSRRANAKFPVKIVFAGSPTRSFSRSYSNNDKNRRTSSNRLFPKAAKVRQDFAQRPHFRSFFQNYSIIIGKLFSWQLDNLFFTILIKDNR